MVGTCFCIDQWLRLFSADLPNWLFHRKHWHMMQSPSVISIKWDLFSTKINVFFFFFIALGDGQTIYFYITTVPFSPSVCTIIFSCTFYFCLTCGTNANLQDRRLWLYADYIFWNKHDVCGRWQSVFIGAFLWAGSAGDSFDTGRLWFTQAWMTVWISCFVFFLVVDYVKHLAHSKFVLYIPRPKHLQIQVIHGKRVISQFTAIDLFFMSGLPFCTFLIECELFYNGCYDTLFQYFYRNTFNHFTVLNITGK